MAPFVDRIQQAELPIQLVLPCLTTLAFCIVPPVEGGTNVIGNGHGRH